MLLNDEEKKLFDYVDGLIPENGTLYYDLRDPKQYAFATMMTKKAFDTDRYPGKLRELELLKADQEENGVMEIEDNDGLTNGFTIPGVGLDPATQNVASNGLGTMAGGFANMSLLLFVKDNATGGIITHGSNAEMTGTVLSVQTPPASGSNSLDVTSHMHFTGTPLHGDKIASGMTKQSAYSAVSDPNIIDPMPQGTVNPYVPNAINIGLGRQWTDQGPGTRLDYAWNEPNKDHPIGKIPFVGNVVFDAPIQPLVPNDNFLLQIYVADQTSGGMIKLDATNLTTVYNNFSIDHNNPNQLNWDLSPHSTNDDGNPITFGNVTWSTDMSALFYCQIIVTLNDTNHNFGSATVMSIGVDDTDDDPLDGVLGIEPIAFIWHCLGEGSLVTMANGSTEPIENLLAGDMVQTNIQGDTAEVLWTTKGRHIGEVYQIIAENDTTIVASHNHLFITTDGPIAAEDLAVGKVLITTHGDVPIVAIEHIPNYDGMMYNLAVEEYQSTNVGTFIANGMEVGDINAQRVHRKALTRNKAWVKQQVPEYLHQDVDAYFEDNNM